MPDTTGALRTGKDLSDGPADTTLVLFARIAETGPIGIRIQIIGETAAEAVV